MKQLHRLTVNTAAAQRRLFLIAFFFSLLKFLPLPICMNQNSHISQLGGLENVSSVFRFPLSTMRTPRIVILGAFLLTTLSLSFIFLRSSHVDPTYSSRGPESSRGGLRGLFSFHAPLSLFPPNAIISLTDDNTTSFLARPADFGPSLPSKGLSGELWIGSGFGDDSLRQGTIIAGAEGDLGCSDVPGWVDGNKKTGSIQESHKISGSGKGPLSGAKAKNQRRGGGGTVPAVDRTAIPGRPESERVNPAEPSVDDGTDDYLHHPLPGSTVSKPSNPGQETHDLSSGQSDHADIQSIQEGAEIAGKIVLLSRGGCGFLEKVKWVQRRGGIALIVGDNTRGGPLIQMYARGDTSNVSIPSIFTSNTAAHLLSSLIPPGSYIEDTIDENGKTVVKVHQSKSKKGHKKGSKHIAAPTDAAGKAVATSRPVSKLAPVKGAINAGDKAAPTEAHESSWFSWLSSKPKAGLDNKAAFKKGKLDWVLNEWDDTEDVAKIPSPKAAPPKSHVKGSNGQPASGDGFVIGVQDWRDPDLVDTPLSTKSSKQMAPGKMERGPRSTDVAGKKQFNDGHQDTSKMKSGLEGGSITPGSGEYEGGFPAAKGDVKGSKSESTGDKASEIDKSGLLTKIFGDDEDESAATGDWNAVEEGNVDEEAPDDEDGEEDEPIHEGLWVTLTPTSGASPFFDTLLVLVVSPLVTLTVVYALLLLRSRIRRRRWRAPKSVVERLPVRTYQTVTSTNQSRLPSPTSSSPTTPLLQHPMTRRPRSRTTSGLPEPGILLRTNSDSSQSSRTPSRAHEPLEKGANVTNEWKKYMGKQVECVVCLEEYVDGVSRVMSLPCGHEFHVDCM